MTRKYYRQQDKPFFWREDVSPHFPRHTFCEHCWEPAYRLRYDSTRGTICRHCDGALDAMERETRTS